jgi:hypothetical protein
MLINCPSVSARVSVDTGHGGEHRCSATRPGGRRCSSAWSRWHRAGSSACAKPALATATMAEAGRADTVSPWRPGAGGEGKVRRPARDSHDGRGENQQRNVDQQRWGRRHRRGRRVGADRQAPQCGGHCRWRAHAAVDRFRASCGRRRGADRVTAGRTPGSHETGHQPTRGRHGHAGFPATLGAARGPRQKRLHPSPAGKRSASARWPKSPEMEDELRQRFGDAQPDALRTLLIDFVERHRGGDELAARRSRASDPS